MTAPPAERPAQLDAAFAERARRRARALHPARVDLGERGDGAVHHVPDLARRPRRPARPRGRRATAARRRPGARPRRRPRLAHARLRRAARHRPAGHALARRRPRPTPSTSSSEGGTYLTGSTACARRLVRAFVRAPDTLETLDASCAATIPRLHTPSGYPVTLADARPADLQSGPDPGTTVRQAVTVAAEAVADSAVRGAGHGLRGGDFDRPRRRRLRGADVRFTDRHAGPRPGVPPPRDRRGAREGRRHRSGRLARAGPPALVRATDDRGRHRGRRDAVPPRAVGARPRSRAGAPRSAGGPLMTGWPKAARVDAGGRDLRVSSPDRVIFPATERTPEITKLRGRRVLPRGRRRHPARAARPADDARALAEGRASEGIVLSPARRARRRRLLPEARPDGRARLRRDGRIQFPSGRHADEVCPTEHRGRRLVRADGDADLPSVAGALAPTSTIPTSCASTSTRSRGPTSPTRCGSPATARELLGRPRHARLPEDLGRARRAHLRAHRAALDVHRGPPRGDRLRPRARAPPARRGDDEVVEGGARRARLRRLQPERPRPHDRLGVLASARARARRCPRRWSGTSSRTSSPRTSPSRRCPRASPSAATSHAGDRRRRPLPAAAARPLRARTPATCRIRPSTRRCRASPSACSRLARATEAPAT